MKKLTALILCFCFSLSVYGEEKLTVAIIGGGPAGLASAIEAKLNGANVIVVEKRTDYSRRQIIFIDNTSLTLLQKWQVDVPEMDILEMDNKKIGVVAISSLEEALAKKVNELCICKLIGEFKQFKDKKALLALPSGEFELGYDVLIAADGTHSSVRDALGIEYEVLKNTTAATAFVPMEVTGSMTYGPVFSKGDFLLRKITTPGGYFIMVQHKNDSEEKMDQEKMSEVALQNGWDKESQVIASGNAKVIPDISVVVQKARHFSDRKRSAFIIGDAAACGTFLDGEGANYALRASECTGALVRNYHSKDAFQTYNKSMSTLSDELVNSSLELYKN